MNDKIQNGRKKKIKTQIFVVIEILVCYGRRIVNTVVNFIIIRLSCRKRIYDNRNRIQ